MAFHRRDYTAAGGPSDLRNVDPPKISGKCLRLLEKIFSFPPSLHRGFATKGGVTFGGVPGACAAARCVSGAIDPASSLLRSDCRAGARRSAILAPGFRLACVARVRNDGEGWGDHDASAARSEPVRCFSLRPPGFERRVAATAGPSRRRLRRLLRVRTPGGPQAGSRAVATISRLASCALFRMKSIPSDTTS